MSRYWGIYSEHQGWWVEGDTSPNFDIKWYNAKWTRIVFYPHQGIARAHLAEIHRRFADNEWSRQWQVREFLDAEE